MILRKIFCFVRRQAGGNAGRDSINKILWILLKMGSDFVQQTPPNWLLLSSLFI